MITHLQPLNPRHLLHLLQVLPKAACAGIESSAPGCTDASGEYLWANAYREALGVGFKYSHGTPDWAMMLNAPNRRGVHQVGLRVAQMPGLEH
jgi:hypothetical protein